jgi:hypothetical protein
MDPGLPRGERAPRRTRAHTLSAWGAPYSPPHDVPIDATVDTTAIPFDQLRMMRGTTFFKRLAGLLVDNPPYPDDEPILKKLEAIDVVPGQDFDADNLDPNHADALDRAARAVFHLLETAPYELKTVNGRILPPASEGTGRTTTPERSLPTWASAPSRRRTAFIRAPPFDGDGKPLDRENEYVIHFERTRRSPRTAGSGRYRRTESTSSCTT